MNRRLDKIAQVCREILGMLSNALNGAIIGSVALEVRLDRVGFVLDEETRQDPDALSMLSDKIRPKNNAADRVRRRNA